MADERNRSFDDRDSHDSDPRDPSRDAPRPYDGGRDAHGGRYEREDRNFRGGGTGYGGTYGREREDGPSGHHGGERESLFDPDRPRGAGHEHGNERHEERGFLDRAGDEVRSWFGDEEAERRRERDERDDARWNHNHAHAGAGHHDPDYRNWRQVQIDALDRDYDEYRRENAARFEREFAAWRGERGAQRDALARVTEHMKVLGSEGAQVGTVDAVRGDRIILTRSDADAGGRHHAIPSRWIDTVAADVTLRRPAHAIRDWESVGERASGGEPSDPPSGLSGTERR